MANFLDKVDDAADIAASDPIIKEKTRNIASVKFDGRTINAGQTISIDVAGRLVTARASAFNGQITLSSEDFEIRTAARNNGTACGNGFDTPVAPATAQKTLDTLREVFKAKRKK